MFSNQRFPYFALRFSVVLTVIFAILGIGGFFLMPTGSWLRIPGVLSQIV